MGIPQGGRRPMREMVGRSIRRVEDPRLLRGQGCYVDDLHPTGPLHAAADLETATGPGAPLVWPDAPKNVASHYRRGFGDAAAAFAGEGAVTVRERFVIARSAGAAIEPRSVLAVPAGGQGPGAGG